MFAAARGRRAPVAILSAFALTLAACSPAATPASPTAAPAAAAKPTTAPAAAAAAPTTAPAAAAAKPAAAAGTVSCAEFATQGGGGAPIKIGADGSLTRATATFGTGMKRRVESLAKEIHDTAGEQGR